MNKKIVYLMILVVVIAGVAGFTGSKMTTQSSVTQPSDSPANKEKMETKAAAPIDNTEGVSGTPALETSDTVSEEAKTAPTSIPLSSPAGSGPLNSSNLPLGDQKFSSTPKVGYIYSCQSNFNGGGAHQDGEWISSSSYDATGKVTVDGANNWPNASIQISRDDATRTITANGLPTNHGTGNYPVSQSDDAYQYDRNPNTVAAQNILYTLPVLPEAASAPSCLSMGAVGIALNGVAIFNGFDAAGRDAVAYEIQDSCDGHPEQSGEYHYHGGTSCFNDELDSSGHSSLFGYALDGFGIFGHKSGGSEVINADLDVCHGHMHTVLWDDEVTNLYHYHLTHEYPYTLGCFMGKSMQPAFSPPSNAEQPAITPPTSSGPPTEAMTACQTRTAGSECGFKTPQSTVTGTCKNTPEGLACVPTGGPQPR